MFFSKVVLNNVGPIRHFACDQIGAINLAIGPNGCGKTFLLKSLYSSIRAVEQYKRGKELKGLNELLTDKLHWTFQPWTIGNIVSKGERKLSVRIESSEHETLSYSFGPSTEKSIPNIENSFSPRLDNSIFIPAKEILSLRELILKSNVVDRDFGFDDTYTDLAKALSPTTRGRNLKTFSEARNILGKALHGKIEFDEGRQEWVFHDEQNQIHSVSVTSEGIKKLSIIDVLLGNHYLTKNSVIFIDEPESALHPALISSFMEIIYMLSKLGIQFFIATHSYFVIKKLYIIAQKNHYSVPVFSFHGQEVTNGDLAKVMPDNDIIEESVKLYEEEISL